MTFQQKVQALTRRHIMWRLIGVRTHGLYYVPIMGQSALTG